MRFNVKAMRAGEGITALALDAANESDAMRQAESQGYTVLTVATRSGFSGFRRAQSHFPLVLFSHELLALLDRTQLVNL